VSDHLHALAALTPVKKAGCAPEPVWTVWRRRKSLVSAGVQTLAGAAHTRLTIPNTPSWLF